MMKKYLLFAFAALVSVSASAQIGTKTAGKPVAKPHTSVAKKTQQLNLGTPQFDSSERIARVNSHTAKRFEMTPEMRASFQPVSPLASLPFKGQMKADKTKHNFKQMNNSLRQRVLSSQHINPSKAQLQKFTASKKVVAQAPRKVGQFKQSYLGTGLDMNYDSKDNMVETPVEWEVTPVSATLDDGTVVNAIFDIVPTDSFRFIGGYEDGIPFEYEIVQDSFIVVPSTIIAGGISEEGDTIVWRLFTLNQGGVLLMALHEDGRIQTLPGQDIIIGQFSSANFDFNKYEGFLQYTECVKYRYDGQPYNTTLQTYYAGRGLDYFDKVYYDWTMVNDDENQTFVNFIPVPTFLEDFFDHGVTIDYTVVGNEIQIQPTALLSYTNEAEDSTFYLTLCSAIDEEGIIRLKYDENGKLATVNASEMVVIGEFINMEFDPEWEEYAGAWQIIQNPTFKYEGQLPDAPAGVSVSAYYDGYGIDNYANSKVQWDVMLGKMAAGNDSVNVIVQLIPTEEFASDYPNGIAAPYTRNGNTITVKPLLLGTFKATSGTYYCYQASYTSSDGSITLTVDDDGSLKLPVGEQIEIAAFTGQDFDPTFATYVGSVELYKNIKIVPRGEQPAPDAEYQPDGLYLHANLSPSAYGFINNYAFIPAFAEQSFTNVTDEADEFAWSIDRLKVNDDRTGYEVDTTYTATTYDFSFPTTAFELFYPAKLTAWNNGKVSDVDYQWGLAHESDTTTVAYVESYLNGSSEDYTFTDGTGPTFSIVDPSNSLTLSRYLATPDVNQYEETITTLYFYQGKPLAPLYIEGVNALVFGLKDYDNMKLKCKIVEATLVDGQLELGDVIAESNIDPNDVVKGYDGGSWDLWQLNWKNFYVTDENGFTNDVDHLTLTDEFAIVFEGWDNGTFSCSSILSEYYKNLNGHPYTFLNIADEEDLYHLTTYAKNYIGFINPIYGYMVPDGRTDIYMPNEGGNQTLTVEPLFYTYDEEENPTTLLDLIYVSENDEEVWDMDDIAWLDAEITREAYTEEDYSFDLTFTAQPLTSTDAPRQAYMLFEQPGSLLEVTVYQGIEDGVAKATVNVLPKQTAAFDLSGRKAVGKRGLLMRNGKKFFTK